MVVALRGVVKLLALLCQWDFSPPHKKKKKRKEKEINMRILGYIMTKKLISISPRKKIRAKEGKKENKSTNYLRISGSLLYS